MPGTHVFNPALWTTGSSAASYAKAYTSAVQAGDLLWALVWQNNASNTCTGVSDSVNGSWTQAFGPIRGDANNFNATLYGFFKKNSAAGTPTATASWSGSGSGAIVVGAVRGLEGGGEIDQFMAAKVVGPFADGYQLTSAALAQSGESGVGVILASAGPMTPRWTAAGSVDSVNFERLQVIVTADAAAQVFGTTGSNSGTATMGAMLFRDLNIADTTPPTLTSPTGTGGTLTCAGSVSTNESTGTLYAVFTASATAPTAVQVEAGQDHIGAAALRAVSQAVSATGAQSIASGSITSGTRYAHYMHKDAAGNRSAVASSASFSVAAGGDTTPPTMTGSVTVTPASTTASALCPAAADNVAVTAYECSIDGGSTWPFTSATPTISITGLTPSTAYTARFRARDAAGNLSTPVLVQAFNTLASGNPTVTVPGLAAWTGTLQASLTVPNVVIVRRSDRAQVLALTNVAADSSGNLVISNAALAVGVGYMVFGFTADGANGFQRPVTAV